MDSTASRYSLLLRSRSIDKANASAGRKNTLYSSRSRKSKMLG